MTKETEEKIKTIIKFYKADFIRIDRDERYKWIAVKHFQNNWDIDSLNFADMFMESFSKHINLLDTGVVRPLHVLLNFAQQEPDNIRALFKILYNETLPLEERIRKFTVGVDLFVSKMRQQDANWKNSFQDQHAISVYLTFMYPEKYYIYKYSILKNVAPVLGMETKGERLLAYRQMCDAIHNVIQSDDDLKLISKKRLGNNCYQDPENRMLAMDIAFFAYQQQLLKKEEEKLATKPAIFTEFKKWLESPTRNNGKYYDYKTVKVYLRQLEEEARKLTTKYYGNSNLFTYETISDFVNIKTSIIDIINTQELQISPTFPKVLNLYEQFLLEREKLIETKTIENIVESSNAYNRKNFLDEVFLTAEDYDSLINQLIRKKNLILQGAPGVGKTFVAKRLVYSLIGSKTSERINFVQFHQSYGYEDFVRGYRPNDVGFEMQDGAFYSFCKKAQNDPENDWFFIIDEINRGNISKIFGELLMLIEADKRGADYAVRLQGAEESFFVPENVHIIGMMNTADRSIALIDYALRRRFAFYSIEPAFESEGFRDYIESKSSDKFNNLIVNISKLNDEISDDPLLGNGFKIGHSYFYTNEPIDEQLLRDIILYEIKPLLSEYWVDNTDKVQQWIVRLLEAVQ